MFVNAIACYLPENRIDNSYFYNINGLTDEWIRSRTGIKTRTKAAEGETIESMSINAVENLSEKSPYPLKEIDLIIAATYTPFDTIATLAHIIQRKFAIADAKAVYISTACSSFINAMEIVEGYFAMNKASKALVVVGEHNSLFSNESSPKSGHLWGDGTAAVIVSKERVNENDAEVIGIYTRGLGDVGKGKGGVRLNLNDKKNRNARRTRCFCPRMPLHARSA